MNRVLIALAAMLAVLLCAPVSAVDLNVQRDGVPQFCATGLFTVGTTYNFTGACTTPPPPVGTCPAGRQTTGDVSYRYGMGAADTVRNVDLTQARNIWGRTSPSDPIADFPFRSYFAVLKNFKKAPGNYVAAQFTVPIAASQTIHGQFGHGETLPGPTFLTSSISTRCGDFNPATACVRASQPPGGTLVKYRLPQSVGACMLVPGVTYFHNLKAETITGPGCAANAVSCPTTISNNWSN
jgi:hypothetical protein